MMSSVEWFKICQYNDNQCPKNG